MLDARKTENLPSGDFNPCSGMSSTTLNLCIPKPGQSWNPAQLAAVNPGLEQMSAPERVRWSLDYLPHRQVLTSSFGAQAAVMLHMLCLIESKIPVLLIDTGYLFPETYRFIDQMVARLGLDLRVYRPLMSPECQENRFGKLWEAGADGIRRYNRMNKVEPMSRALKELAVGTWFSGLRRSQSDTRSQISVLQQHGRAVKVHPIADWSNHDVHRYLKEHKLPYHPLWDKGYVSIGDTHTSRPLSAKMTAQDSRFFGLLRECGLHEAENFQKVSIS